jgi:superfamily I DNA and/or RNA helicase
MCSIVQNFKKIGPHDISKNIAVITFYAAQVQTIKFELEKSGIIASIPDPAAESDMLLIIDPNKLKESKLDDSSIRVMTVDSFQGSESIFVIVSFVRSNSSSNVGFVNDFKRLNVSLTRAKHTLILVGCCNTLANCKSYDLQCLIEDCKERNRIITSNEYMEFTSSI